MPDGCSIVLAVIFPPLAVLTRVGMGCAFWLNVVLTLMGYFPGLIHAVYLIGRTRPVRYEYR